MTAAAYKGVVLAGGRGTRLYPSTRAISKQLLPVYDKPLIYYPLSVLMLAGLREMLIITTPEDAELYRAQLGDGAQWGVKLDYAIQDAPRGLAEALIIAEPYLDGAGCVLALGDNIFFGPGVGEVVSSHMAGNPGATVFVYPVKDPRRYGVVAYDKTGAPIDILEKPDQPPSDMAVTGLYIFSPDACAFARAVTPSARGELEIADVHRAYLKAGRLDVAPLGRGLAWFDAGTHEALLEAANFVHTISARQGLKIACLEEIGYLKGYIDDDALRAAADALGASEYGVYLQDVLARGDGRYDAG